MKLNNIFISDTFSIVKYKTNVIDSSYSYGSELDLLGVLLHKKFNRKKKQTKNIFNSALRTL